MALVLATNTNPGSASWQDIATLVSGASGFVVWRSGVVTSAPVYGTFAEANAAAIALRDASDTPVILYCAGDANEDVTIEDLGVYDMNRIRMVGLTNNGSAGIVVVRAPDGVNFTDWWYTCSYISLFYTGNTPLCTFVTAFADPIKNMIIGPSSALACTFGGTDSVFRVTGDGVVTVEMLDKSVFLPGDALGVVLDVRDTATVEIQMIGNRSEIVANSIRGDATSFLNIDQSGAAVYNAQAAYLGTLNQVSTGLPYIPNNLVDWSGLSPTSIQNALDRLASAVGPVA